jgi:imidazolonepropionase-like amidohydrolase
LKAFFQHGLTITQLAHRSGIPIMAGTDANDTMIVPGFSLHRELALLARAGLSNMDVLRSATAVPAAYLGRTADLGRIAPGMEADLVLLRANPLSSISNTTTVDLVVTNGRAFHRQQLDELLEEVELLARQPAP